MAKMESVNLALVTILLAVIFVTQPSHVYSSSNNGDGDDDNGDFEDESIRKNFCTDYGMFGTLCHGNMTKPGCPTGPARDLLFRPECELPFFQRNVTNSTSPPIINCDMSGERRYFCPPQLYN
jgi:hypothetical protein